MTTAFAILMVATCCEAAPLERSEPQLDEQEEQILLEAEDSGAIENGLIEQYNLHQSIWRLVSGASIDGCGMTSEQYQTIYGTNNADFDTEVFSWANGQYDMPPKSDDDCLDQVEFKRLFLFWNGDGDEDLIDYLDQSILPNYQGMMDDKGYDLHKVATGMSFDETPQEALQKIFSGICIYLEESGQSPLPEFCEDGSFSLPEPLTDEDDRRMLRASPVQAAHVIAAAHLNAANNLSNPAHVIAAAHLNAANNLSNPAQVVAAAHLTAAHLNAANNVSNAAQVITAAHLNAANNVSNAAQVITAAHLNGRGLKASPVTAAAHANTAAHLSAANTVSNAAQVSTAAGLNAANNLSNAAQVSTAAGLNAANNVSNAAQMSAAAHVHGRGLKASPVQAAHLSTAAQLNAANTVSNAAQVSVAAGLNAANNVSNAAQMSAAAHVHGRGLRASPRWHAANNVSNAAQVSAHAYGNAANNVSNAAQVSAAAYRSAANSVSNAAYVHGHWGRW